VTPTPSWPRAHPYLKGQNWASVNLIVTALRTEDLEQLPRRHLKLDQPLTLVNEGKAQDVGKEARG